jgi:hypothetical protein
MFQPDATVRYTVMTFEPRTPSAAAIAEARKTATPNGTYEFSVASAIESLDRISRRKKWQQEPERGTAVIKTWHNRHPSTLAAWVRERASRTAVIEVPSDAPPTWFDVVEDLVERRAFARMICPHCANDYGPGDLQDEQWHRNSPNYESAGHQWSCPRRHVLFEIVEWWIHRSERAATSWRRED